jgi:ABC-type antimicrobial peptide transport system permease subunit
MIRTIFTGGRETDLLPAVRDIIRAADPDEPISDVRTLTDLLSLQTAPRRAQVNVLAALATVALLLAGIGIHGLLAFTVAQQRHNIAVQLALGAEPARIARAIVSRSVRIVLIGLVPGLLVAVIAGSSMRALLFGMPALVVVTIAITLAVCIGMAVTGACVPVLLAVRVSPMAAIAPSSPHVSGNTTLARATCFAILAGSGGVRACNR